MTQIQSIGDRTREWHTALQFWLLRYLRHFHAYKQRPCPRARYDDIIGRMLMCWGGQGEAAVGRALSTAPRLGAMGPPRGAVPAAPRRQLDFTARPVRA